MYLKNYSANPTNPTPLTNLTLLPNSHYSGIYNRSVILPKKRGRPKKDIDDCVIFHMLKNNATIIDVAKHLKIHRDTIYTNFRSVIDEARASFKIAWRKIMDEWFAERLEKKKMKEIARKERIRMSNRARKIKSNFPAFLTFVD